MDNRKLFPSYHPLIGKQDASTFLQSINMNNEGDIEKVIYLTKHSTPTIEYKTALKLTKTMEDEFSFNSFMQRLENFHIGITRTSLSKTSLTPNYIRLCDPDSSIFFNEYISEQSNKAAHDMEKALSTNTELKTLGMIIPRNMITPLDISHAKKAFQMSIYANAITQNDSIYSIPLSKKDSLYCTQYSIPIVTDICMIRLRMILNDAKLLPLFAKVIEMSLTEAQDKINSEQYIIYENFISQCYTLLPQLKENPKLSAYTDVFDYITILNNLIQAKIQQDKINTQTKKDISSFQDMVLQELYMEPNGIAFNKIDDYLENLARKQGLTDDEVIQPSIKTFHDEFMIDAENPDTAKLKKGDVCIIFDGICIHNMVILNVLTEEFQPLCNELRIYYTNLLQKFLESKLNIKDNVFLSEETLEIATHQKVQEMQPLYAQILKSPVLLAGLLSQKKVLGNNNALVTMSNSKKLSLFFNLRTKEVLPWHKIFNVNLTIFTEEAYKNISQIRRWIMVLTGKFKSIKERIAKLEKLSSTMEVDEKEIKELLKKQKQRLESNSKKEASIKTR